MLTRTLSGLFYMKNFVTFKRKKLKKRERGVKSWQSRIRLEGEREKEKEATCIFSLLSRPSLGLQALKSALFKSHSGHFLLSRPSPSYSLSIIIHQFSPQHIAPTAYRPHRISPTAYRLQSISPPQHIAHSSPIYPIRTALTCIFAFLSTSPS